MRNILFISLAMTLIATAAWADESQIRDESPNKASDASFDKRLPPVLPGEELKDNGKKIKVWSTSGPVPVGQAPQPFDEKITTREVLRSGGVIIDTRNKN